MKHLYFLLRGGESIAMTGWKVIGEDRWIEEEYGTGAPAFGFSCYITTPIAGVPQTDGDRHGDGASLEVEGQFSEVHYAFDKAVFRLP